MHGCGSALLNEDDPRSTVANQTDWQTLTKAAFIFGIAFAIYFASRSPGLDEWDSVQFAMGIREFNLWKHQPHPPGYPLYIFFAWLPVRLFGWNGQKPTKLRPALRSDIYAEMNSTMSIRSLIWSVTFDM